MENDRGSKQGRAEEITMAESSNGNEQQCRVFGLTRASTLKQSESPATQREIISVAAQNLKLQSPIFLDEPLGTSGRSGKFAQRPMGNFILHTLRKGDTLIVTKVDRLGRSLRDIYDTVDTLSSRGINVIILHGFGGRIIDMRNATDRMFLLLLAWFAEYEGERIAARTKEGLQFRRDNGLATGKKQFCYIQAYDADGCEIPAGEYSKLKGHHKRHLPDRQWLDQILELLALQKHLRAKGLWLYRYCEEKRFVTRDGWAWWRGKFHAGANGSLYTVAIPLLLKRARRMAVFGQLPEDYNERVLMITGDTPADLAPKWKRKPRNTRTAGGMPDEAAMKNWSAEEWYAWWITREQGEGRGQQPQELQPQ
jgi:DNA invertase Pin-like site-specific DNA recombinase